MLHSPFKDLLHVSNISFMTQLRRINANINAGSLISYGN